MAIIKSEKCAATITNNKGQKFVLKKKDFIEISGNSPKIAPNRTDSY